MNKEDNYGEREIGKEREQSTYKDIYSGNEEISVIKYNLRITLFKGFIKYIIIFIFQMALF